MLWAILLFFLVPAASSLHDRQSGPTKFRHQEVVARHGAVATDYGRCSRIGIVVLREGGHAIDAAVAAALCLGVESPASCGIGGGAFMLIRLASGEVQAFDNMYNVSATLKASGALSVAVPGELSGL
ncbi:unnamed protein product [Dovyalis caffra]|uniref:Gamma-glutamyltransferase n=1 Tax=Dovyalis caffra TaxID=77055 RepID=A0AAV1RQC9_9ROSI|nr:unnamed protein product [Dovyalis caffra]